MKSSTKTYNLKQIAVGALLGGPIASCILLANNFKVFDEPEKAKKSIIWGVIATVAVLIISFLLPDSFPNSAIPIGYTFGIYYMSKQLQEKQIEESHQNIENKASWWKVIGIGFLCLLVLLAVTVGIGFMLPDSFFQ